MMVISKNLKAKGKNQQRSRNESRILNVEKKTWKKENRILITESKKNAQSIGQISFIYDNKNTGNIFRSKCGRNRQHILERLDGISFIALEFFFVFSFRVSGKL